MRLTIINQFYKPDISPTAQLAASLAEHRVKLKDEVRIIASAGGYVPQEGAPEPTMFDNPRIHRIWSPNLGKSSKIRRCIDYGVFYLLAAWNTAILPRQDIIIALTTPPFIVWAALLHKFLHPWTRVILWNMDCYPEAAERTGVLREGSRASRIMRGMNRKLFGKIDHLIVLDSAMRDLLLTQYAPPRRPVPCTIIPNWEPAAMFPLVREKRKWAQAEGLGLSDQFVVLYLGNTGYGHQFETVLDAAEQLRDEKVTFFFVGGGSRWDDIRRDAEKRGLSNVLMHDYVPKEETPTVMAGADCALITLRDIVLGVMSPSKLHANLAAGLPILYVGPRGSNVDDAIAQFNCGAGFRHGDVDGVVKFVRELKADRARHLALRQAARAAFDAAYCDTHTLPAFDRVIDEVLRRRSEPPTARHEPSQRGEVGPMRVTPDATAPSGRAASDVA
ncbi:MAG: glycosyltransferase family 4 protein [Phycisphaerales bacterium]|nr:glycosyltransferase family 4 protein [Phycisphaerales bacterium]